MAELPNSRQRARERAGALRVSQVAGITGLLLVGVVLMHQPRLLGARDAEPTFAPGVAPLPYANRPTRHPPPAPGPSSPPTPPRP